MSAPRHGPSPRQSPGTRAVAAARPAIAGLAVMALMALITGLWLAPAQARDPAHRDTDDHDHDRALQAVQAGEALPLATVLQRVPALQKGQILEVELERHDGRWVYEIKILQPDGRLVKFEVDARTATLTGWRGPSRER